MSLSKRKVLWMGINVLAIVIILISSQLVVQQEMGLTDMAEFRLGLCFGLELIVVKKLNDVFNGLRSDEKLRALYIKEHDERRQLIMQQTGSIGFEIAIVGLMVAIIVSSFFNQVVMITLTCVILFLSFVKGILKLYYHVLY
ncbi:MAG: hypothetical protein ACRCST_09525 [Turicibacter sp.]